MKKSVPGFIFGLIGGIFSIFWGFIFGIIGDAGASIIKDLGGGTSGVATLLLILGWLCFVGGIVSIIGASFCFKNAKKGAITMTVATVASAGLLLYVFFKAALAGGMIPTLILIFLLPVGLMVAGDVCAFTTKTLAQQAVPYVYQPQPQANEQPAHAEKTLEQELTELKAMFDKNLLNEEEYDKARKAILDKHTK